MQIKLEMRKSDNSVKFEQYFDEVEDLTEKIAQIGNLFDFYSISIDNKLVTNDKPIKGALDAFSNTFSN